MNERGTRVPERYVSDPRFIQSDRENSIYRYGRGPGQILQALIDILVVQFEEHGEPDKQTIDELIALKEKLSDLRQLSVVAHSLVRKRLHEQKPVMANASRVGMNALNIFLDQAEAWEMDITKFVKETAEVLERDLLELVTTIKKQDSGMIARVVDIVSKYAAKLKEAVYPTWIPQTASDLERIRNAFNDSWKEVEPDEVGLRHLQEDGNYIIIVPYLSKQGCVDIEIPVFVYKGTLYFEWKRSSVEAPWRISKVGEFVQYLLVSLYSEATNDSLDAASARRESLIGQTVQDDLATPYLTMRREATLNRNQPLPENGRILVFLTSFSKIDDIPNRYHPLYLQIKDGRIMSLSAEVIVRREVDETHHEITYRGAYYVLSISRKGDYVFCIGKAEKKLTVFHDGQLFIMYPWMLLENEEKKDDKTKED